MHVTRGRIPASEFAEAGGDQDVSRGNVVGRPTSAMLTGCQLETYPNAALIAGWPLVELGETGPLAVDPPRGLYLWELMDLDLPSDEEAVEFIRRWGPVSPVLLDGPPPWTTGGGESHTSSETIAAWSAADEIYTWRREHGDAQDTVTVNLAEFRLSVAILRDLIRVLLSDAGAFDFGDVCASWESAATPPPDAGIALEWGVEKINRALGRLNPRVELRCREREEAGADVIGLCCLQLFDDLVSERPYRRCGRCGRVFTTQRNRASQSNGRRHSSARYCSARCASAASSQMHRERQRTRREAAVAATSVPLESVAPPAISSAGSAGTP